MSLVIAVPELMAEAATDLKTIGSALNTAHYMAAAPTLDVLPAAADEVSASIAQLFSDHGEEYQELAAQAAAYHEQFAQHLTASAGMYASAEAVNAGLVQPLAAIIASILEGSGLPGTLRNVVMGLYLQVEAVLKAFFLDTSLGYLLGAGLFIGLIIGIILSFITVALTAATIGEILEVLAIEDTIFFWGLMSFLVPVVNALAPSATAFGAIA